MTAALSKLDMPEAPWTVSDANAPPGCVCAARPAPRTKRFIFPELYGRDELPRPDAALRRKIRGAPLTLTRVSNVVAMNSSVLLQLDQGTLHPASFPLGNPKKLHNGLKRLKGLKFRPVARIDPSVYTVLDRPSYYADIDYPDIYGHFLIEVITRLWGLGDVDPNVPVISSVKLNRNYVEMLSCLEVRPDRWVNIDRPIHCSELLVPSLSFERRNRIHPAAWEIFDRLKPLAKNSDVSTQEKIYISRTRATGRTLVNEGEIEAMFEGMGFAVIHPQELSIGDQIKVFGGARCIAGPGGSAMHNAIFAREDARILIFCSDAWLVKADMLINQKRGRLGYVFGEPLTPPTKGHRTKTDWRIDMEDVREGARLHFDLARRDNT